MVAGSRADAVFCTIVQRLVNNRIRFFLRYYIGNGDTQRFFDLLNETGGAITGAVPRCIITFRPVGTVLEVLPPPVMNIAVPFSNFKSLSKWRRVLGGFGLQELTAYAVLDNGKRRVMFENHVSISFVYVHFCV